MSNNLKQELRKEYLLKLKKIDVKTKKIWDKEIFEKFINSDYFKKNQIFALYWSLNHEVDTHEIIKILLATNKKVCLPRIKDKELVFYFINDLNELVVDNKFNIAQPSIKNIAVNPQDIEIFLIPLVAFDKTNNRLGYGGGFYDRFLNKEDIKGFTIGLAYKIQLINNQNYKCDQWDIPLFSIITNK